MGQYFSKPYEAYGGDINVKVDLSNHTIKTDLKNASGIDTSKLAAKSDLSSLKTKVDKLLKKLTPVPADFKKISNVLKNGFVKKRFMIN